MGGIFLGAGHFVTSYPHPVLITLLLPSQSDRNSVGVWAGVGKWIAHAFLAHHIPLNLGESGGGICGESAEWTPRMGNLTFGRQCVQSLPPQRLLCLRIL